MSDKGALCTTLEQTGRHFAKLTSLPTCATSSQFLLTGEGSPSLLGRTGDRQGSSAKYQLQAAMWHLYISLKYPHDKGDLSNF